MATAIVPPIYDPALADQDLEISTEDAYGMVKRLAGEEGILVGISAGAALVGCVKVAEQIGRSQWLSNHDEAVIVTVLPDAADKYLSERFWEE